MCIVYVAYKVYSVENKNKNNHLVCYLKYTWNSMSCCVSRTYKRVTKRKHVFKWARFGLINSFCLCFVVVVVFFCCAHYDHFSLCLSVCVRVHFFAYIVYILYISVWATATDYFAVALFYFNLFYFISCPCSMRYTNKVMSHQRFAPLLSRSHTHAHTVFARWVRQMGIPLVSSPTLPTIRICVCCCTLSPLASPQNGFMTIDKVNSHLCVRVCMCLSFCTATMWW